MSSRNLPRGRDPRELHRTLSARLRSSERLRGDIVAYRRAPPSDEEVELASLAATTGLEDETDWAALYAG